MSFHSNASENTYLYLFIVLHDIEIAEKIQLLYKMYFVCKQIIKNMGLTIPKICHTSFHIKCILQKHKRVPFKVNCIQCVNETIFT